MSDVKFSRTFQIEINTLLDLVKIKPLNRLLRTMLVDYIRQYKGDMEEDFYDTLLELNFLFGFLDAAEDERTANSLKETPIPSEEIVIPSEEIVIPSEEMVIPSKEIAIPSEEMVVPSEEIAISSEETVIPSEETAIRSEETAIRSEEIAIP